jgi:hypothetical protein
MSNTHLDQATSSGDSWGLDGSLDDHGHGKRFPNGAQQDHTHLRRNSSFSNGGSLESFSFHSSGHFHEMCSQESTGLAMQEFPSLPLEYTTNELFHGTNATNLPLEQSLEDSLAYTSTDVETHFIPDSLDPHSMFWQP